MGLHGRLARSRHGSRRDGRQPAPRDAGEQFLHCVLHCAWSTSLYVICLQVTFNLVHEVGLFTKQNSFYFQSESFGNVIEGNIAYNGPRAGVNCA